MASCSCSWTSLPAELLGEILNCLDNVLDILRCWRVCVSWRLAATNVYQNRFNRIPLLLMFDRDDLYGHGTLCNILTGDSEKILLPDPQDWWICNSTNGWLLTIHRSLPHSMNLYNPISRNTIFLPSATQSPHGESLIIMYSRIHIRRCITSTATPLDKDCVVLMLYDCNLGRKLASCKPGDRVWKSLHDHEVSFGDIMVHKGQLYAADCQGKIYCCSHATCPEITIVLEPPFKETPRNWILMESFSGEILMIKRNWDWIDENDDEYKNNENGISFELYNIDLSRRKWRRIETLGDEVLFLGPNCRISVSVLESSSSSAAAAANSGRAMLPRGNCIYFIHNEHNVISDDCDGTKHASRYNLETRSIKQLQTCDLWKSQFHWIALELKPD